jgi:hypothetical protein
MITMKAKVFYFVILSNLTWEILHPRENEERQTRVTKKGFTTQNSLGFAV